MEHVHLMRPQSFQYVDNDDIEMPLSSICTLIPTRLKLSENIQSTDWKSVLFDCGN